jgi:hypothetical protein
MALVKSPARELFGPPSPLSRVVEKSEYLHWWEVQCFAQQSQRYWADLYSPDPKRSAMPEPPLPTSCAKPPSP